MASATNPDGERRHEVELHSHDFEWEELARVCQAEQEESDDVEGSVGAGGSVRETEGLADEAKSKWDAFHARNKGVHCVTPIALIGRSRKSDGLHLQLLTALV